MKRILVATDFSARSDRALRRAVLLSRSSGASLLLVHVVDDDQPRRMVDGEREVAAQYLAELTATLREVDAVSCSTAVLADTPFAGIVDATESNAADLLVLGPHRRRALLNTFVGTTAERTIRSATCPVLMANATPRGHYQRILIATDLTDDSRQIIDRFVALGIASNVSLSLLYVFDAPALRLVMADSLPRENREAYLQDEREAAERSLRRFTESVGLSTVKCHTRFETGSIANEILAAAQESSADLIVVGTRGRGGLARLFLGSVATEVLRQSAVDVLAIPPQRRA